MGHCVTSWAIRLNPLGVGFPLMALPMTVTASLEAGIDAWRREISQKYFGFEGGMDAADLISRCDFRLRAFSAVQWTGLKDGCPAPTDHLLRRIEQWIAKDEPWWLGREAMLAAMRHSTTEGLSLLEPVARDWPVAARWGRAGRLQLEYLDLLQAIFVQNANWAALAQPLSRFQINTEAFFGAEQAPLSAQKNAALIVDPLRDYLAGKELPAAAPSEASR